MWETTYLTRNKVAVHTRTPLHRSPENRQKSKGHSKTKATSRLLPQTFGLNVGVLEAVRKRVRQKCDGGRQTFRSFMAGSSDPLFRISVDFAIFRLVLVDTS